MRCKVLTTLATFGLALSLLSVLSTRANAATASSFSLLGIQEDSWYNYDFLNQYVAFNNVDWPLTMLFYNNANLNKVRNIYWGWPQISQSMSFYVRDTYQDGYIWRADPGTKRNEPGFCSFVHMRIYGSPTVIPYDAIYNTSWGYYILGTSHYDQNECSPPYAQFGWSEEAEYQMALHAANAGYSTCYSCIWFYNPEAPRWEGNHFWNNGGAATHVNVP